MNKTIIAKLTSILEYYETNYQVNQDNSTVLIELMANNVEVHGDSFYCPMWTEELNGWVLLAGTKDKADTWVLKKILKLIKTGAPVYSVLNGNSGYLLKILERYDVKVLSRDGDMVYIAFNTNIGEG